MNALSHSGGGPQQGRRPDLGASAAALPRPGPVHGPQPQRHAKPTPAWLALADAIGETLSLKAWRERAERSEFRTQAAAESVRARALDVPALAAHAAQVGASLVRQGFRAGPVARAQAVIGRAIEAELGKRPYATQQEAAYALLRDRLVEMDTGEGKSLALLLACGTAALARVPTHVVCANEYLAVRDAETAGRVLARLGVSVGSIRNDMTPAQRRDAYACAVVYVSAQELGFDYLRDRVAALQDGPSAAPGLMRGLCLALIDEADSVLLDHARTPLVLAEQEEYGIAHDTAQAVYKLSASLRLGRDCMLHAGGHAVALLPGVQERLRAQLTEFGLVDDARVQDEVVREALQARHVLHRDVHYVVRDDAVILIDPTTGRTLPGSVWSRGLHRMVCLKEGVAPPRATRTVTQITLQELFGRYCKLGGISGTLRESAWQLWWFYRVRVQRVLPRVPSRRRMGKLAVYATRARQFEAIRLHVAQHAGNGQAVLVGTDSVAAADALSADLTAAGIAHQLLTARDDSREAALIAAAGASGAVTVATNIAGRGTDILLAPATLAAGGLHVLCCTQNVSPRIDRQLIGRAARNGQPGSATTLVSLEDRAFSELLPMKILILLRLFAVNKAWIPGLLGTVLVRIVQTMKVFNQFKQSWQLVRHDRMSQEALSSAAQPE